MAASSDPAAQAMRPQLGSWPYTAALTRLLPAMDRATALAAASSAAPRQVTCNKWQTGQGEA